MPIRFIAGPTEHNHHFKNRRAAKRQTQAERDRVYAKYMMQVGTLYKNALSARREADRELRDPQLHPEYWDDDVLPRQPLALSSSCFSQIVPSNGGVFLYFRSNPSKGYFYPSAGTTAETAKRVYDLLDSRSLGHKYHAYWGAQNGARKKVSKSGKSVSYRVKGGKSLNLSRFDRIGARYGLK